MGIKFYGKSQDVAEQIIKQFQSGTLPQALTPIFVNRRDNIPSSAWSWTNRFMMAIYGTNDARGFKQWKTAGRMVSKGAKAFHILGPITKKITAQDKNGKDVDRMLIFGFKSIPVFAIENTEIVDAAKWEKTGGVDTQEEGRLMSLPFREVADAWELDVTSFNGKNGSCLGYYSHAGTIALGVKNLSTWTHELIHAADDRLGTITKKRGQQIDNEIVAEVGGAILLELIGEKTESDKGGAWEYVLSYSGNDEDKALRNCMKFINRICSCVDAVLTAAAQTEEIKQAA